MNARFQNGDYSPLYVTCPSWLYLQEARKSQNQELSLRKVKKWTKLLFGERPVFLTVRNLKWPKLFTGTMKVQEAECHMTPSGYSGDLMSV